MLLIGCYKVYVLTYMYRVSLVVLDFGWVEFSSGCSIVRLIPLGQVRIWQSWLGS